MAAGRDRKITGQGKDLHRREEGLGTGETGSGSFVKDVGQAAKGAVNRVTDAAKNAAGGAGANAHGSGNGSGQNRNVNPYSAGAQNSQRDWGSNAPQQSSPTYNQSTPHNTTPVFTQSSAGNGGTSAGRSGGKGLFFIVAIILIIVIIIVAVFSCSRGCGSSTSSLYENTVPNMYNGGSSSGSSGSSGSSSGGYSFGGGSSGSSSASAGSYSSSSSDSYYDYFSSLFGGNSSYSSGWTNTTASPASASLNTSVAAGSRDKYTQIKGDGSDIVTIMVYMCGSDLESESGMASMDIQEMTKANIGDNINLILYTGGATRWQNSVISSRYNQIYQVKSGGVRLLQDNAGTGAMTNPETLASFIQWGASNFPADRYELIFWDHGSGSVSGYGYDEKYKTSGSMSLAGINRALKAGGIKYDFVGFDACLMATMETALMLGSYADYLIASEETEPGYGWYYTDWLNLLNNNTSTPTVQVGKQIVDDFITTSNRSCPGQLATLSVVDLAELSNTAPSAFNAFSNSITELVENDGYKTVSNARSQTREFAQSSSTSIDQIDLTDFAQRLGNSEGQALADAVLGAVKYNRTVSSMTNAYGLSIFFPYRNIRYVDKVTSTYNEIGIDSAYTKCIQKFATMEAGGQAGTGGYSSPWGSIIGSYSDSGYSGYSGYSSSGSGSSSYSDDYLSDLISSFLGGSFRSVPGLDESNTRFIAESGLSAEQITDFVLANRFDPSGLTWTQNDGGDYLLAMSDEQKGLIHDLDLNVFYDDGEGYINLGLDNVYDFDEEGNIIADNSGAWLSINDQPVPYYHTTTVDNGGSTTIYGKVPAILNGETRIDLIITFAGDEPGAVSGAYYVYDNDEEPMSAKNLTELNDGDTLDFICDYYSYDGEYIDSYMVGDQIIVSGDLTVSDTYLPEGDILVLYRITDIYGQQYWTDYFIK